jgi:hypothetical protein
MKWHASTLVASLEVKMSEPVRPSNETENANASFWAPPSLDELLRDVEPGFSLNQFEIEDLTDQEWEACVLGRHQRITPHPSTGTLVTSPLRCGGTDVTRGHDKNGQT